MGTSATASPGMMLSCVAVVVSSVSAAAETSTTVVPADPAANFTGRVYTPPAVTVMLSNAAERNPDAATSTLYVPSGRSWKANSPPLVVVAVIATAVATLVAFTLAPATTAPDGSVTVPLMAPRNVCAYPVAPSSTSTMNRLSRPLMYLSFTRLLEARW